MGVKPAREPQPELRCNACHTSNGQFTPIVVERIDLVACVDPISCRLRAQNAGIYKLGAA